MTNSSRLSILITTIVIISRFKATTNPLKSCYCWKGYEPTKISGEYQCFAGMVFHLMPCNVLQPPECVCTGNNSILKDRLGTWCAIYKSGREIYRWACENAKDWMTFFKAYM
ncbi:hypothetical protein Trydic_g4286 [Trypoxylus dichotomus]